METQTQERIRVDSRLFAWMREIRRDLHRNPELSLQELRSATYVRKKLEALGIESRGGIGGTGVVAEMGPEEADVAVGLRADMDALPIIEATGLSFASINRGIMHACGHDGHVAMLLGAASILRAMELPGRVRLLFQPAEERGNGAEKMIEDGAIENLDGIFSGHIDTHHPTGIITVDEGIICAYADPFVITLKGSSGHAARPHETRDTIIAAAGLVTTLQSLVAREVNPNHAAVLTVGKIQAGEINNVIAGDAIIEGTIRSTHPEARKRLLSGLARMVHGAAPLYSVETEVIFPESLPAVVNSGSAAAVAAVAAAKVVPEENVISQGPSSLGGEDFAFYLQEMKGCLVRFGAKVTDETGPAHSSTFDFDEDVLSIGAAWYARVALEFLQDRLSSP